MIRRINQLEKQVVADNPDPEETFLSIHNETEQALHERAEELRKLYNNSCSVTMEDLFNPEIPLLTRCDMAKAELDKMKPQDLAIIDKSHDLIDRRILDLFIQNHTACLDKYGKTEFIQRLMWFLSEFQEWYRQQEHAQIIEDSAEYQKNLEDDNAPDLVDEYFKTQRECFTAESWDTFFEKYILPIYRKHILKDNLDLAKETVKNEQSTE